MSVRQELHTYIDDIEESKLEILKPLLCSMAEESTVIETGLTDEERELIAKGMEEYAANPQNFVPLESI
jgi:hypothetical protein